MDLKLVQTFLTAAKLQNLTKTAENLGYAQSTVTAQIKTLESELNITLFDRLGKSISLSPDGKAFIPYAKSLLSIEQEMKQIFNSDTSITPLTIGASQALCDSIIPRIVGQYQKAYPAVPLTIRIETSQKLPDLLKSNEIDLAFCMDHHPLAKECIPYKMTKEPISFYAAYKHPACEFDSLSLQDLCSYPLLLTAKDCFYHQSLIDHLDSLGLSYRILIESDNLNLLKQFAIEGTGILFLPDLAVQEELSKKQLIFLKPVDAPTISSTVEILLHKNKQRNGNLSRLLSIIDEIFPSSNCLIE